jgi:hypothetical protein
MIANAAHHDGRENNHGDCNLLLLQEYMRRSVHPCASHVEFKAADGTCSHSPLAPLHVPVQVACTSRVVQPTEA